MILSTTSGDCTLSRVCPRHIRNAGWVKPVILSELHVAVNGLLHHYDVFMVDSIFYTFIGLMAGIIVDISYGFIDPRIRMGEK